MMPKAALSESRLWLENSNERVLLGTILRDLSLLKGGRDVGRREDKGRFKNKAWVKRGTSVEVPYNAPVLSRPFGRTS
jgi:hypothetical protein